MIFTRKIYTFLSNIFWASLGLIVFVLLNHGVLYASQDISPEDEISNLLTHASEAFLTNQYGSPPDDKVVDYLTQIFSLDPMSSKAMVLLDLIVESKITDIEHLTKLYKVTGNKKVYLEAQSTRNRVLKLITDFKLPLNQLAEVDTLLQGIHQILYQQEVASVLQSEDYRTWCKRRITGTF